MARLVEELTTDFSAGQVDGAAPTTLPRNAVSSLINARIEPDGLPRRRPGSIRTHPTLLHAGTGFGGTRFTTAAGVDLMVAFFGTKAFKSSDKGATWTEIATGLREDYYDFATMRVGATNYLYAANADTTVKRYDGTTWDTNPNAPSGVKFQAVFNSRLWYAGHNGVLIQATKIANPAVLASPDGLTVQNLVHSGDVPTGLFQIGPHLLVFSRKSTSYIDGFGEQTIIVATGATGFSRSVGCVSFRSIQAIGDNGVCWLSERGVEYYSVGAGIQLVTNNVEQFLQGIDWEELYANPGRITSAYDAIDQNYWLALSTDGIRNNRILVLNIQQQVQYQRPGPRVAASIDVLSSPSGDVLFTGDADGYLTGGSTGLAAVSDADGYMTLTALGTGGEPVSEDADGYLESDTNDALPASLFVFPATDKPTAVHSLGYDGFVRRHHGVGKDDVLSDGSGGTDVQMTLVSRAFFLRRARQRKRVRGIHVGVVAYEAATVTAQVHHTGDELGPEHSLSFAASASDHATRKLARTLVKADDPHVEVRTTNDVKVALLGISAELLREPI